MKGGGRGHPGEKKEGESQDGEKGGEGREGNGEKFLSCDPLLLSPYVSGMLQRAIRIQKCV